MATKIAIYICDPHIPWQRGSNENTNGLMDGPPFRPKIISSALSGALETPSKDSPLDGWHNVLLLNHSPDATYIRTVPAIYSSAFGHPAMLKFAG